MSAGALEDCYGEFREKKALITGGMGFIGSNLARKLLELGAKVTVVDNMLPEYGGNEFNLNGVQDKIQVNISDVRDRYSLQTLVKGQDYLFNLAGQNSHLDSMENPYNDLEINCRAQLSILEACRHHNPAIRVVFASTRQIYGKPDYLPVDEKHPLRPVDVNGINKIAGESYHMLYHDVYGLNTCSLRLTNTIGPRMRVKDARQTFLGIWIRCLLEDKPFEVWQGDQVRDFTYVDDAVTAFLLAATKEEAKGQAMNLGADEIVRLTDLATLLVKLHGKGDFTVKEFPENRKRIDIGNYHANDHLARALLGWKPETSLRDALEKTLVFYQKNLSHYL